MRLVVCLGALAAAAAAQTWEAGVFAGGGFYTHREVVNRRGTAQVGFDNGIAAGAFLGQNLYRRVSGEIRYTYQRNALAIEAAGARPTFSGDSHAVHYDWLIHTAPREARMRPFLIGGAGFKRFRGTGTEAMRQALSDFALMTKTTEWKPVVTFGAGLKWRIGRSGWLRLEVRDYLSPFPKKLIAPAPGATLGGWIHNFVPTVGLSVNF